MKRVHFLRHGQAQHNPRAEAARSAGCSFDAFLQLMKADDAYDAELTALGRAQAEEASRVAVEELLGRALRIEAGDGERALELAHELAREARGLPAIDPLTERLDEVTRQLKRAQHRVLLAAAEPDAAEREQGEGVLSGLEIALVAWESDGLAGAPLRRGELEAAR